MQGLGTNAVVNHEDLNIKKKKKKLFFIPPLLRYFKFI